MQTAVKKLRVVGQQEVVPTDTVQVRQGDWSSYLLSVAEFKKTFKALDKEDHEWKNLLMQFQRERIREYLGPHIRSYSREPKVLTPEVIQELAEKNLEARKVRAPYFVKIAELLKQIDKYELMLNGKMV